METVSFPNTDDHVPVAVLVRGLQEGRIRVRGSAFSRRLRHSQPAPEPAQADAHPGWLGDIFWERPLPPARPARRRNLQGAQDAPFFDMVVPLPRAIAQQDFGVQ